MIGRRYRVHVMDRDDNESTPQKPRAKISMPMAIAAVFLAVYLLFPAIFFYPIDRFNIPHWFEENALFEEDPFASLVRAVTSAPPGLPLIAHGTLPLHQRLTMDCIRIFFYPIEKLAHAIPAYHKLLFWETRMLGIE